MKRISTSKGILIFYAFDILLLVVLLIAFIPSLGRNSRAVESAVLNPKYRDKVSLIKIEVPFMGEVNSIVLEKHGDVWTGNDGSSSMLWPADVASVNNMLDTATNLVKMYKKSDRVSSWDNLMVDEKNAKVVTFCGEDGEVFSQLFYGIEDPITQRIVVRSGVSETVMETENKISTYLNPEQSFWCDPFIFPQCLTEYSREKSESLLRHGKLCYVTEGQELETTLTASFENESSCRINVYKNSDNTYTLKPAFKAGPFFNESRADAVEKLNYSYSVSQWTYEKLVERIGEM